MGWTPERVEMFRTLYADPSLRCRDIGDRLGASEFAVRHLAHRLKLPKRTGMFLRSAAGRELHRVAQRKKSRHSPDKIARIRQMWDSGVSAGSIGTMLGETKNVIVGILNRSGAHRRPGTVNAPWTEDEDGVLRGGVTDGQSHREIAMRLPRRTAHAVALRCGKIGLSLEYAGAQALRFRQRIKRHHKARESDEARKKARSNIFMVNLAHKRIAVKAVAPLRSIVCESVPFTPEHRGCAWLTSDGRPWMVCAGKGAVGVYCSDHFKLSIGAVDPEPDEPAEAIPMLEAA